MISVNLGAWQIHVYKTIVRSNDDEKQYAP